MFPNWVIGHFLSDGDRIRPFTQSSELQVVQLVQIPIQKGGSSANKFVGFLKAGCLTPDRKTERVWIDISAESSAVSSTMALTTVSNCQKLINQEKNGE